MTDGPRPSRSGVAGAPLPDGPASKSDDLEAVEQASVQMKGFFARGLGRVGPAVRRFAERAKNTVTILGSRQSERWSETASVRRAQRTTAPAPGGGLHAAGRRVLRGQSSAAAVEAPAAPQKTALTKRRVALAGGVMIAAILGALALKKMHHEPPGDTTAASASASAVASSAPPPVVASAAPIAPAPADSTATPPAKSPVAENAETEAAHRKHERVTPFANGPVHHGNILHLKMDGPVETIEGAQQPTGFAVKIPGRKSVEAAAPLAARDSRIATIKVSNDSAGAELTVAFKDGVPNYRVSAKGDTLVIALAPPGAAAPSVAKKDENGARSAKHKHTHEPHDKKPSEEEL